MQKFKRYLKLLAWLVLAPLACYFAFAMVTSNIVVNQDEELSLDQDQLIYLSNSNIHLDLIFPKDYLTQQSGLKQRMDPDKNYLAVGWGEENFYLNTPEWSDLTVSTTANALLWNSSSLMHINQVEQINPNWHEIHLSTSQLETLLGILDSQFVKEDGELILIPDYSYYGTDEFFRAHGDYSCLNTCNSWINDCLKKARLPACYWTPYGSSITAIYNQDD